MTIIGVDTHEHFHAVVVLDDLGRTIDGATFGTDDCDHRRLLNWAAGHGAIKRAGVEGTGTYGYRLARFLMANEIEVVEVNRPDRARRRRTGKNDLIDAEAAAQAILANDATAIPKDRTGEIGEIRALLVARRSAVKARTQATNQFKSILVHVDDELRGYTPPMAPSERCDHSLADGLRSAPRSTNSKLKSVSSSARSRLPCSNDPASPRSPLRNC